MLLPPCVALSLSAFILLKNFEAWLIRVSAGTDRSERGLHMAVMDTALIRHSMPGIVSVFRNCMRSQDFAVKPSSLDPPG